MFGEFQRRGKTGDGEHVRTNGQSTTDRTAEPMATESSGRTLDVREIDGPPFDDIVAALESLEPGQRLRLIAPFEPKPLYEELVDRGFTYESERRDDGVWHVLIERA